MPSCPICAEDLLVASNLVFPHHPQRMLLQPCCSKPVCQSCLYRHILSVLQEGTTGQGRSQIACPLGCGRDVTDFTIRACIQRQHPLSLPCKLFGYFVMALLQVLGYFSRQDPLQTSRYHQVWFRWLHSRMERQILYLYERWNLAVALRASHETILHCPAPDCGCAWMVSNPDYIQTKRSHERRRTLWYRPLKPEHCSQEHPEVLPEYINLLQEPPEEEHYDGRRAVCPKCHCLFCGLCKRPWHVSRKRTHAGVSCKSYQRKIRDSDYTFVSQLANARSCPGCSLRTSRIDGCNHMTCPCGKEWCYVCEVTWNRSHYVCVDRPTRRSSSSTWGDACIIS